LLGPEPALALKGRDLVLDVLRAHAEPKLLWPTGGSPESIYQALVSHYRRRTLAGPDPSWSGAICFNLDEYWGLPPWDPNSYCYYMWSHLYNWVDVRRERIFYPDALAPTPEAACAAYEAQIAVVGGFDHALLGIGVDGHIGFNEAHLPRGRTQTVELAASTRAANGRYFGGADKVPSRALTMGIDTILESRSVTLIALGVQKAGAIRAALLDPIGPECPASFLREIADRCTFLLDEAAASQLG